MSARLKTTPNVARSQARKVRRKEKRRQADEKEAAERGISVETLNRERFFEAWHIITKQKKERPVFIPAPRPTPIPPQSSRIIRPL